MTTVAGPGYIRTFSTLGCPEYSLMQVAALARKFRIGSVELRALAGSLDLPAYFASLAAGPLEGLQGLRVAALATSFRLLDGTEDDRTKFLEFIPWAEALAVPRLRIFDGGTTAEGAELERARATMAWWAKLRAAHGWKTDLMIETHDALATSDAIRRFVDAVPGTAILWDSHHTWQKGGEDPVLTWQAIRPHVTHIHVKDSLPVEDRPGSYRYALPGTGRFPMAALRRRLEREFTGPVSLEWERLWHPELPALETAFESASRNRWW